MNVSTRATVGLVITIFAASTLSGGINQWTSRGPEGPSSVTAIVVSTDGALAYAATVFGGVYRSDDGGEQWRQVTRGLSDWSVKALAVAPDDPATVYAGTENGRIFKSDDGGEQWNELITGASQIHALLALENGVVLASTPDVQNLLRSADGGRTWTAISSPCAAAAPLKRSPTGAVACGGRQFGLSDDLGRTWSLRDKAPWPPVIAFGPDGSVFSINRQGTYKSTDGGRTWPKFAPPPLPYNATYNDLHMSNSGTLIAASNGALLELRNGAWSQVFTAGSLTEIFRLAGSRSPSDTVLAASSRGVVAREGESSWKTMSRGLRAPVRDASVSPYEPSLIFAAGRNGKFRSDPGGSWREIGAESGWIAASSETPYLVYAEVASGIGKSSDGGETWTPVGQDLPFDANLDLAVAHSDPSRLYLARMYADMLRSDDSGTSWTKASGNLPSFEEFMGTFAELTVDPSDPSIVYVGYARGLYRTTDGGASWSLISNSSGRVDVDRQDPSIIYATNYIHGLSRSYDRGTSWVPISPVDEEIVDVAVDPSTSGVLHASTPMRVYRSDDYGATWSPLGDGPGPMIHDLDLDASGHYLFAATSAGIYEYEFSAVDVSPLPAGGRDLGSLLAEVIATGASSRAAFVLPVAGFVQGGSGLFTTDVTISNESPAPQNVTIAWLPRDGGDVSLFTLLVPPSPAPSSGHGIPNIAGRVGLTGIGTIVAVAVDESGALDPDGSIDGSATICARERDRNPVCETIPGVRTALFAGHARASAGGLRVDTEFRTNVGITNLDSRPHRYVVSATGERHSGSFEVVVPPFSLVHRPLAAGDYGPLAVEVTTDDPSAPWAFYATTINNRTASASTKIGAP